MRRLGEEAERRPGGAVNEGSGLRWGEVDWEGVLWEAAATKPNRKEGRKGNVATATLPSCCVCLFNFPIVSGLISHSANSL